MGLWVEKSWHSTKEKKQSTRRTHTTPRKKRATGSVTRKILSAVLSVTKTIHRSSCMGGKRTRRPSKPKPAARFSPTCPSILVPPQAAAAPSRPPGGRSRGWLAPTLNVEDPACPRQLPFGDMRAYLSGGRGHRATGERRRALTSRPLGNVRRRRRPLPSHRPGARPMARAAWVGRAWGMRGRGRFYSGVIRMGSCHGGSFLPSSSVAAACSMF